MTVAELGERVSALEFEFWVQFFKLEAEDAERARNKKPTD